MLLALVAACLGAQEVVTIQDVFSTDVVTVSTATEKQLFVSLVGIGTPETADPKKPEHLVGMSDPQWTRLYFKSGDRVYMRRHGKDIFGRVLATLYRIPDQFCWNAWLVECGGAYFAVTDLVDYSSQEEAAKEARRGIWKALPSPKPTPTPTVVENGKRSYNFTGVTGGTAVFARPKVRYTPQDWSQLDAYIAAGVNAAMQNDAMAQAAMMRSRLPNYGMPMGYGGSGVNPNQHQVNGYWRDGRYVHSYNRTNPNGSLSDNLSYPGNR
jgi:endonuclease YncB( thermonuclease family)